MAPTFAASRVGYGNLWRKATVKPDSRDEANVVAERILQNRGRYEAVERRSGVPWFWIAAIHDRESGGDFRGVLHNGEKIIGTGQRTRLVPAGRGPFSTWEEAAYDALAIKGLPEIKAWPIERMLYEAERFNGWGYVNKGVNSPYIWSGTSLQERGKFVADGVFDPNHLDQQLGVAAVVKLLSEIDAGVAERISAKAAVAAGGEPEWLTKARGYIGFHETGTNRGIEEFISLAHTGSLGDPWCAIFTNAMLESVGVRGTRSAAARSFERHDEFISLDRPILGCVVTFWRGSASSGSGHVGFYLSEDADSITILDGNSSDEVGEHEHPKSRWTGYWWPRSVPLPSKIPTEPTMPEQPIPQPPIPPMPVPAQPIDLNRLVAFIQQIVPLIEMIVKILPLIMPLITAFRGAAPARPTTPVPAEVEAPAAPKTGLSSILSILPMLGIQGGLLGLVTTGISIAQGWAASVPASPTTGTAAAVSGGALLSGLLAKLFGKR